MLDEEEKSECLLHRTTLFQLHFLTHSQAAFWLRFLSGIVVYRELHLRAQTASIYKKICFYLCVLLTQHIYYQLYALYHEQCVFEYSRLEADPGLPRAESQPGSGGSSAHALLASEERRWDYTLTSTLDVKEEKCS